MNETPLLEVKNLKKYFKTSTGMLHAVDGINFKLYAGKTIGVVGESGCGKSTLGRTILRLTEPTSGEVLYRGENVTAFENKQMRQMRKKRQIIFQDPYSSIEHRMTVEDSVAEYMKVFKSYSSKDELKKRVDELLDTVGLASRYKKAYPHELDGGRRQRVGIARALSVNPEFIVCDEPVSALDVSIQAQVLNLLMDLQEHLKLTYMFITHDLSVVKHVSNDIMVMYLGQCVEMASSDELFNNPLHPYTQALLSSIPIPDVSMRTKEIKSIKGEIVSPINPSPGCRFAGRCDFACERCLGSELPLAEITEGHFVSCTRVGGNT